MVFSLLKYVSCKFFPANRINIGMVPEIFLNCTVLVFHFFRAVYLEKAT